jgi:hypothetical protein
MGRERDSNAPAKDAREGRTPAVDAVMHAISA